jgi:hypothetical protein
MGIMPIGNEPFQASDPDGLSLDSPNTLALALSLLRTNSSANSRKTGALADDLVRALKIAIRYFFYKLGDFNANGTSGNARTVFTLDTAFRLVNRLFCRVPKRHFFEVTVSHFGRLRRHFVF